MSTKPPSYITTADRMRLAKAAKPAPFTKREEAQILGIVNSPHFLLWAKGARKHYLLLTEKPRVHGTPAEAAQVLQSVEDRAGRLSADLLNLKDPAFDALRSSGMFDTEELHSLARALNRLSVACLLGADAASASQVARHRPPSVAIVNAITNVATTLAHRGKNPAPNSPEVVALLSIVTGRKVHHATVKKYWPNPELLERYAAH